MRSLTRPVLACCLIAGAATAAYAADLPSRRAPPVYVPPPIPVFTWTGFFVGGNAGADFGSGSGSQTYNFAAGSIAGSTGSAGTLATYGGGNNNVGFTGGGQIGYNYELGGMGLGGAGLGGGGLVVGAVADAQYLDRHTNFGQNYTFTPNNALSYGNAFVPVPGLPRTNVVTTAGRDNFFGTVRGRLGVTFGRALVYGTGGFAYDTHATGYTYGGGIEYALTNSISVGAEYLHVDLSRGLTTSATYVAGAGLAAGTLFINRTGGHDEFNVARAVLNYHFATPAVAPVVARY